MGTSYGSVLMIEYFDIATTNFWINVRCLHECNPSLAFFATKWGYWANNCWKYKQTNLKYLLRILPILPRAYRRTIRSCLLFCKHGHYRAVEVCCGGRQNDWFAMLIGLWPCEMPFGHLTPPGAHRQRPIFFFFKNCFLRRSIPLDRSHESETFTWLIKTSLDSDSDPSFSIYLFMLVLAKLVETRRHNDDTFWYVCHVRCVRMSLSLVKKDTPQWN